MVMVVRVSGQVTPHFSWTEFACRDTIRTPVPLDLRERAIQVAEEAEALREACGRVAGQETPLRVTSAYRTPAHNARVGGAPSSQHLSMRALDVACPEGLTFERFKDAARQAARRPGSRIRRLIWYPADGFLHFDIRPSAVLKEWTAGQE